MEKKIIKRSPRSEVLSNVAIGVNVARRPRKAGVLVWSTQGLISICAYLSFFVYLGDPTSTKMALPVVGLCVGLGLSWVIGGRSFGVSDYMYFVCLVFFLAGTTIALRYGRGVELSGDKVEAYVVSILAFSVLFSARLASLILSPSEIMQSFAIGGAISIITYVVKIGPVEFLAAGISGLRLSGFGFHPNLLAYCAATFAASTLIFLTSKNALIRLAAFGMISLNIVTTFQASSRGSFGAASIGLMVYLIGIYRAQSARNNSGVTRKSIGRYIAIIVLATLACFAIVYNRQSLTQVGNIIYDQLALGSEDRGLSSGFTGRTDTWSMLFSNFELEDFLVGVGMRQSFHFVGDIDNSYIVLFFENGIIAFLVILGLWSLRVFGYARIAFTKPSLLYGALGLAMVSIILSNNFVARYLLAVGNPGSLFACFLLAIPVGAWTSRRNPSQIDSINAS